MLNVSHLVMILHSYLKCSLLWLESVKHELIVNSFTFHTYFTCILHRNTRLVFLMSVSQIYMFRKKKVPRRLRYETMCYLAIKEK